MKQLTRHGLSAAGLLLVALSACADNSLRTNAPAGSSNAASSGPGASSPVPKSPLEGIVRANASEVEVSAGESAETSVRLSIESGYHVNANPATEKFLIPTALEVKPEAGIAVEKILYPKPLKKKFSFHDVPLDVYEREAEIKLTLRAARDTAAGQHTLRARLRVQPCDDEKCYPPTTIEASLPVTIR